MDIAVAIDHKVIIEVLTDIVVNVSLLWSFLPMHICVLVKWMLEWIGFSVTAGKY